MAIDRTVPSERNNTYDPSDVSRKTNEDLFETAFNSDQQQVLNKIIADIPQPTPPGPEVPEPTAADNGKVLGVDDGEYALVEQSGGGGGGIEIKYGLIRTGQTSYSINHLHEDASPTPATADDFQDIASQMAIKDLSNSDILWKTNEPSYYGIGLIFSTMRIIEGSGSYIHAAHVNKDVTVSMIEKTL